ncbi:MAG TPA: class I SAM-dependent methyltransferase [Rubrobacteraceae bacterium]|nr:class I SAM-dependent methyltransferase [Rubrobacteraceae bacterium]
MSSYENYTEASRHYDRTREPVGTEIIVGCMAHAPVPLSSTTILDAGCGTGSYSRALLDYVGRIEAVDLNDGMLEVAGNKLARARQEDRIAFTSSRIDELPFGDGSLDGVMINQVLHHLPDDASDGFPEHGKVFREFARVLRPGGVLTVNTCSQQQLRHGYWYYDLIPRGAQTLRERFAPITELKRLLQDSGFDYRGRFTPTDATIQGDSYFDPRGPLSQEWRNGDSTWSLVREDELRQALSKVRELEERGEIEDYLSRNDARRKDIGQITILFAIRQ